MARQPDVKPEVARGGEGDVVFVKLGGSLITDKSAPETARQAVIARLADELSRAEPRLRERLIVGHGSGSFGHPAAARFELNQGIRATSQLPGIHHTQNQARRLHLLVTEAIAKTQLVPLSIAPSSTIAASEGRAVSFGVEPLILAYRLGLVPVVYGDIVMDRERGVSIFSTEMVLLTIARRFRRRGIRVRRMLWVGDTDGIYDQQGNTIPCVTPKNFARVRRLIADPVGTDVTGGMVHRLRIARVLARLGIPSWILNGSEPGVLESALLGTDVAGTEVMAG